MIGEIYFSIPRYTIMAYYFLVRDVSVLMSLFLNQKFSLEQLESLSKLKMAFFFCAQKI